MFRQLWLCAVFLALAGSAGAQEREAVLQKVDVPGAGFDLIVAMPKADGVIYDLADSPDALLVRLAGGGLALGFERPEAMLTAANSLRRPVCAFVDGSAGEQRTPVAIYLVPKAE